MSITKAVLITGGMSDIGRAIATAFAQENYAVALNYRHNPAEAEAFASALIKQGKAPHAITVQGDIRLRNDISNLFDHVYREFGRVDVLINNAGINCDNTFTEMSDDEWETVISTILTGTFRCSQEFARRNRHSTGNIINIGAVTAVKGRKNGANYCSARAGVLTLTRCMALELAPGIRVNAVTPGRIDTKELQERYQLNQPGKRTLFEQDIPLARLGTPEDIARMILFLVAPEQYITGQNFFVDGGLFMH